MMNLGLNPILKKMSPVEQTKAANFASNKRDLLVANIYYVPKNCRKINWEDVTREFGRYGLRVLSAEVYARGLKEFCRYANISPDDFAKVGLEQIENYTTDFIASHRDILAPKYLNVIYNAVKRWCYIKGLIKSTKMFKEIKFDKSSRKTSGLMETMIETKHVKTAFKISELNDKVDLGLYGLVGLRPQLIPQLKVKDIYRKNYTIDESGKFQFTVNPPIMMVPREYKGNKGNITFMVFIPSKLAELIEMRLNAANGKVTPETKLSEADNSREIYYKMKKILNHPSIAFRGRPYLLRSFADNILERITHQFNDDDFKEFLMGHKGNISAIYQMRGLTDETEKAYRDMYVEACDKYISENIFETISREEREKGSIILEMAKNLGVVPTKAEALFKAFESMKLSFPDFNDKITALIKESQDKAMEAKFEAMFLKMSAKHNNH